MTKEKEDEIKVIVFSLENTAYAIPLNQVREIVKWESLTPLPQAPTFIQGMISVRGRWVAVIDLKSHLGLAAQIPAGKQRVLVVRLPKTLAGLTVDRVDEILSVSEKTIQPADTVPGARHFLIGMFRRNDRPVLLLNIEEMVTHEEEHFLTAAEFHLQKAAS